MEAVPISTITERMNGYFENKDEIDLDDTGNLIFINTSLLIF